jgi:hypothetical protein
MSRRAFASRRGHRASQRREQGGVDGLAEPNGSDGKTTPGNVEHR